MQNRQTIIVVLAVIALFYGLYEVVLSKSLKAKAANSGQLKQTMQDAVRNIETRLASIAKTGIGKKEEQYIVRRIETRWEANPFAVEPAIQKALTRSSAEMKKDASFVYSAYIETSKNKAAIINDSEYMEGDQLETVGYYLKRITPKSVIILHKASKSETEILFTDKGD
ncbi:MAG: hypothetical protein L7F77_03620 [Candidatus Magnetominusculus sp. LBB02]|nr:hypothetical protein [Candidatus Magnetominusculus sp. LBB02]